MKATKATTVAKIVAIQKASVDSLSPVHATATSAIPTALPSHRDPMSRVPVRTTRTKKMPNMASSKGDAEPMAELVSALTLTSHVIGASLRLSALSSALTATSAHRHYVGDRCQEASVVSRPVMSSS